MAAKKAASKKSPAKPRSRGKAAVPNTAALPAATLTALLTGRSESMNLSPAVLHDAPENRRHIDPKDPKNLALVESIRNIGVCDPLTVRPLAGKDGHYEVRDGKRRLWAARQAKAAQVHCICWYDMDDASAGDLTAVLNCLREDLSPFEDAETVGDMIERHGGDVDAVARILAQPRHWVVTRARLTRLSPDWRKAWKYEDSIISRWTVRHMELIARLDDAGQLAALKMFHTANRREWDQVISTRELQEWIDEELFHRLKSSPFSRVDATLCTDAGACDACPKRTSAHGRLFLEDDSTDAVPAKDDACMDPACWTAKRAAWFAQRKATLAAEHPGLLLVSADWSPGGDHLKQLAEEHGGQPVLARGQYDRASGPKAKGAAPALQVDGANQGELLWIKRTDGQCGTAAPGGGNSSPSAPKAGLPLADRRKLLDSKRWFETLKLARAALGKLALADLPIPWCHADGQLALVTAFGTNHRNAAPGNAVKFHLKGRREIAPYTLLPGYLLEEGVAACGDLWRSVRAVLSKRLGYTGNLTGVPKQYSQECADLCALLDIDLAALRAQAAQTYKEPKSWKSLPGYQPEGLTLSERSESNGRPPSADGNVAQPPSAVNDIGKPAGLRAEIPDGPELFILSQSSGTFGVYRADPGATPERLDPKQYPDRSDLADAEEDLREYAALCGFTLRPPAGEDIVPAPDPKHARARRSKK